MSQQDIDTLVQLMEAFNERDMERILSLTDPEFEAVVTAQLSAEPDTYRGPEGIRRYFESFYEVMDEIEFEAERFWDAGDAVVAAVHMRAKGRRTAIAVVQSFAQLWRMRGGRALRVHTYPSREEALAAAGLAPQAP
jgi:ketosteroid isomerase-like protein